MSKFLFFAYCFLFCQSLFLSFNANAESTVFTINPIKTISTSNGFFQSEDVTSCDSSPEINFDVTILESFISKNRLSIAFKIVRRHSILLTTSSIAHANNIDFSIYEFTIELNNCYAAQFGRNCMMKATAKRRYGPLLNGKITFSRGGELEDEITRGLIKLAPNVVRKSILWCTAKSVGLTRDVPY